MVRGRDEHSFFPVAGGEVFSGEGPQYLSDLALDMLHVVSAQPQWTEGQRRRWDGDDYQSFNNWQWIEVAAPRAQAELDVTEGAKLNGLLHALHTALPYNEAERIWLYHACLDEERIPRYDRLDIIRRQEVEVVSSGLRQVIYGRDLLRRWWAWRRETDEFRGQGTLDLAREALRGLTETFDRHDRDLPEPYKKLRGLD